MVSLQELLDFSAQGAIKTLSCALFLDLSYGRYVSTVWHSKLLRRVLLLMLFHCFCRLLQLITYLFLENGILCLLLHFIHIDKRSLFLHEGMAYLWFLFLDLSVIRGFLDVLALDKSRIVKVTAALRKVFSLLLRRNRLVNI